MSDKLRILAIALASAGLMAGAAHAGPGKDSGDPDIPSITSSSKNIRPARSGSLGQAGASVPGNSVAIIDEDHDRWLKALRAYFRLARLFGP